MVVLTAAALTAAVVLAAGVRWRCGRAAAFLALAIVGQGATLALILAGPLIRFQHLRPPGDVIRSGDAALLVILAVQAVVAGLGIRRIVARWRPVFAARAWQYILFAVAFTGIGAALSRDISQYLVELGFAGVLHAMHAVTLLLAIDALPEGAVLALQRRWAGLFGLLSRDEPPQGRPRVDRIATATALWVIAVTAVLSYGVYDAHPHVPDEVCYYLQARYFAAGAISMPAPPVPEAFELFLMQNEGGRWFSCFPPGWPAVLSLGMLAGVPWLVNPLLAGVSAIGVYLFVWHLYDRATARISLLLIAASPWFLFMGMSWMAHTLTLAASLGGALALCRARAGAASWAVAAGAAVGFVTLIRPFDGILLAALLGLWVLFWSERRRFAVLGVLTAASALFTATVFPYNRAVTGSPTGFPVEEYFSRKFGPGANSIGFGPNHGMPWSIDAQPGHSPVEAVINTALNISSVNNELFGWMGGSLVLLAAAAIAGYFGRRDLPMIAVLVAIPCAYGLYWYSGGPDFGARYWYLTIVPLVALTARSLKWAAERMSRAFADSGPRLMCGVVALSAATLLVYVPWRCADKYHRYLRMTPDVRQLARESRFQNALVFIRGEEHPDYASAIVYNSLDLNAPAPVFVRDLGPGVRARVMRAFPNRAVWTLNGPTITGRGFEIAETPDETRAEIRGRE